MQFNVQIIRKHDVGVSDVIIEGAGVVCSVPFDKTYLMPEVQEIVETAKQPIDWEAVKTACQEKIDASPSKPSPNDPQKFKYVD